MSPVNYKPEGFHSVTPYLVVQGADRLIDFLKQAFEAVEIYCARTPAGRINHAQFLIGDSMIELAEGSDSWKPMLCTLHLYVPDADAVYQRALAAGATSLMEVADQVYGDRSGGIVDPSGNQWFIATKT
jgi:PhnB protein